MTEPNFEELALKHGLWHAAYRSSPESVKNANHRNAMLIAALRDAYNLRANTSNDDVKLKKAMDTLRLADLALREATAILGGEYGDHYGVLCEQMINLQNAIREMEGTKS